MTSNTGDLAKAHQESAQEPDGGTAQSGAALSPGQEGDRKPDGEKAELPAAALKGLVSPGLRILFWPYSLVFIGFAMAVLPFLLTWIRGRFAITTPEYLATSLIGGALAVAGLVGIMASDRGRQNAAEALLENIDVVEALRNATKAAPRTK